mmetsp:Transcript_31935/g.83565  ORF Transcript_31935/g.83565 Transcript_31935/m.83565 type:complete len:224 (-) Transcript_31935:106-777(-)
MVEALRRLAHVDLLVSLDVNVPLDVGAGSRLDLQRLVGVHRVEELLHQLDHQHLFLIGLALHEPQARVARSIGQLLEAAHTAASLVVVVFEGLARVPVGIVFIALPHLLLQLLVLLEAALHIELPVLGFGLLCRDLLGVRVLLILVAVLVLIIVILILLALNFNVIVDEHVAWLLRSLGCLARCRHLTLGVLIVLVRVTATHRADVGADVGGRVHHALARRHG